MGSRVGRTGTSRSLHIMTGGLGLSEAEAGLTALPILSRYHVLLCGGLSSSEATHERRRA